MPGTSEANRRSVRIACALAVGACAAGATFAQQPDRQPSSFLNQQRAVEERLRKEFDAQMGVAGKAAFDWGGWYNFNLFLFDDGVESSRTLRRNDLRLWGRLTLDHGAHEFYARTRLSFLDFNHGDRKSTRLNSSHIQKSRMPSSA